MSDERGPFTYGYLCLPDGDDQAVRSLEFGLRRYAEENGLCLAALFHEGQPSIRTAWHALMVELQRADVRHVIVPSLSHVSNHPVLRANRLDWLEQVAHAEIHVVIADESVDR